jgi:hypothetical protein
MQLGSLDMREGVTACQRIPAFTTAAASIISLCRSSLVFMYVASLHTLHHCKEAAVRGRSHPFSASRDFATSPPAEVKAPYYI